VTAETEDFASDTEGAEEIPNLHGWQELVRASATLIARKIVLPPSLAPSGGEALPLPHPTLLYAGASCAERWKDDAEEQMLNV
jgi:hypothetical protein